MALIQFWPQSQKVAEAHGLNVSLQRPKLLHQYEYGVLMVILGCCISNYLDGFRHYDRRVLAVVTQGGITWCYCDSM